MKVEKTKISEKCVGLAKYNKQAFRGNTMLANIIIYEF